MPQRHSPQNGRFISGGGGSGGKSVAAPKAQGRATGAKPAGKHDNFAAELKAAKASWGNSQSAGPGGSRAHSTGTKHSQPAAKLYTPRKST